MRYEGVTFVAEEVKKMPKEVFIRKHIGFFWLDRDEKTREKMLADVYSRIVGKKSFRFLQWRPTDSEEPSYGGAQGDKQPHRSV